MLSSNPGLVTLMTLAMAGHVIGAAMPVDVQPREIPVNYACCSTDNEYFRLKVQLDIAPDDAAGKQREKEYFRNTHYVAYNQSEPNGDGKNSIPLTIDGQKGTVFRFHTVNPTDTAAQQFHKLRVEQYNVGSAYDNSYLKPYIQEAKDRVAEQGFQTLRMTAARGHSTNLTTNQEAHLSYDDSSQTRVPFELCYDPNYKRTIVVIVHREQENVRTPESRNMLCVKAKLWAEKMGEPEVSKMEASWVGTWSPSSSNWSPNNKTAEAAARLAGQTSGMSP
ncbi:MAG: hypothetical protein M1832_003532 [Thelocarpon impressellum]|nr:MAG: hypothetical protein M1832_003532 [Thelocarpon impressellum]